MLVALLFLPRPIAVSSWDLISAPLLTLCTLTHFETPGIAADVKPEDSGPITVGQW